MEDVGDDGQFKVPRSKVFGDSRFDSLRISGKQQVKTIGILDCDTTRTRACLVFPMPAKRDAKMWNEGQASTDTLAKGCEVKRNRKSQSKEGMERRPGER